MDKQQIKTHAYESSERPRARRGILILVFITAVSFLTAVIAGFYAWKEAHDEALAGAQVAEQTRRLCASDYAFRAENPDLCDNAKEVVSGTPEIQDREIDDPDPNDPDPNDPDPFDDSDPDNPEQQQAETQEAEEQEAETQEGEIQDSDPNDPDPVDDPDPNDPDPDDPDPNDPDPDDPDPGQPGTWNCPDGQAMTGFTRTEGGDFILHCTPMNGGGGPPAP